MKTNLSTNATCLSLFLGLESQSYQPICHENSEVGYRLSTQADHYPPNTVHSHRLYDVAEADS